MPSIISSPNLDIQYDVYANVPKPGVVRHFTSYFLKRNDDERDLIALVTKTEDASSLRYVFTGKAASQSTISVTLSPEKTPAALEALVQFELNLRTWPLSAEGREDYIKDLSEVARALVEYAAKATREKAVEKAA